MADSLQQYARRYWEQRAAAEVSRSDPAIDGTVVELPFDRGLIPRRAPEANWRQLDLSAYYTDLLTEPFHPIARGLDMLDDDLRELPQGLIELGGAFFDVRGVIQLRQRDLAAGPFDLIWETFASECPGMAVGRAFERIHILHSGILRGAVAGLEGKIVAVLVCHYADGSRSEFAIVYGRHVREWEELPGSRAAVPDGEIAWRGSNPVVQTRGTSLRLYRTGWDNPRPDQTVTSIDYVSRLEAFAPFLVAITLE
jgi:hypothetical protein